MPTPSLSARASSAFASATKPATGTSSARAVSGMPGLGEQGACIRRQRLEALAQHLAALPEGGAGDGLERA